MDSAGDGVGLQGLAAAQGSFCREHTQGSAPSNSPDAQRSQTPTIVVALDERQQHEEGYCRNVLQQQDTQRGLPEARVQLAALPQQLQGRQRQAGRQSGTRGGSNGGSAAAPHI